MHIHGRIGDPIPISMVESGPHPHIYGRIGDPIPIFMVELGSSSLFCSRTGDPISICIYGRIVNFLSISLVGLGILSPYLWSNWQLPLHISSRFGDMHGDGVPDSTMDIGSPTYCILSTINILDTDEDVHDHL